MKQHTHELVEQLAKQVEHLPQPIHLLAICTGGTTVSKIMRNYLRSQKKKADYYEVWINRINGKALLWKTDFTPESYTGTAVIVEDVIWQGSSIAPTKRMLRSIDKNKKIYVASLLDCNHKADFAVYR